MSLSTYYHTIKYLKAEQLWFQIYYKLRAKVRSVLGKKEQYTFYREGHRISFIPFPEKSVSYKGENMFCFLNQIYRFEGTWDERTWSALWRYNLNYMDFILQPSLEVADGVTWIDRFIDAIDSNKIASDPYPISLRGINWIKFVSLHWENLSDEKRKKIDTSLYSQYRVLTQRVERHLLANHYLENGLSLLFASIYFRDTKFWDKAKDIVEKQLDEQILHDGAHYELSPMYHCIILERVLDCLNLLHEVDDTLFEGVKSLKSLLQEKACKMLAWLDAIVVADDRIPLLNDSAYGVALSPKELRDYATRMGLCWRSGVLDDSGYRRVVRTHYETILDMAPLGVSYNLGHAHADTGTFLLWVNGHELLVDAGTSTYNAGDHRNYERSTCAHNTVVVDDENSSKVWGAFRCAQRARVTIEADGPELFTLSHDGYSDKGITLRRTFVCKQESMEITDMVQGKGDASHKAKAYFHLAPNVKILQVEKHRVVTDKAMFSFREHDAIQIINRCVAKEYNSLQPSVCVQVEFHDTLTTIIEGFER